MSIQQLMVGGNVNVPLYVGYDFTNRNDVSSYTADSPSAAQIGDLIVFYGFIKANDNAARWSVSGVTELQDSNANPNLYIGYKYLAAVGERYTVNLSRTAVSSTLYCVAYRNVRYGSFSFVSPGTVNNANISITPSANNASIVGYIFNNNRGSDWAYSETAPSTTSQIDKADRDFLFRKNNVSGSLSYSFTGLNNSEPTQAGLVALLPA